MNIRPYSTTDLVAVAQVFTDAVHVLAAPEYDEAQRTAWAPRPPDISGWRKRMQQLRTFVAVEGSCVVGFISYATNGHIDLLHVSPSYARRGVASALYERVEIDLASSGVTELFTEASLVARPFFERAGFAVAEEQEVSLRGSSFRRFAMRKRLVAAQQGAPADVKTAARFRRG